jgi:twitching motility protein PilT
MQTGQATTGMITMNQSLAKLYIEGVIDLKEAEKVSPDIKELKSLIKTYRN